MNVLKYSVSCLHFFLPSHGWLKKALRILTCTLLGTREATINTAEAPAPNLKMFAVSREETDRQTYRGMWCVLNTLESVGFYLTWTIQVMPSISGRMAAE